jgi:hypothetical protein
MVTIIVAQCVNCIRMQRQRADALRIGLLPPANPFVAALRPFVGAAAASNRFHEPGRVCRPAEK